MRPTSVVVRVQPSSQNLVLHRREITSAEEEGTSASRRFTGAGVYRFASTVD